MNKEAILGLTEAYGKTIGSKPWIEAPVLAGVGALGGYLGGDLVVPKILNTLMVGKSEQEKADILQSLKDDKTMSLVKNLMGGAGGVAGLTYGLQKHLDVSRGMKGLGQSFVEGRDYWDRPEAQEALDKRRQLSRESTAYAPSREGYTSGRTYKQASYGFGLPANFEHERVPISESLNLINDDPFLTLPQKEIADMVLEGAENSRSGLASGKDLMRSAVKLGVGAATGYVFGRAASSLFSLPPAVTKRLSRAGALAGSIINSGIFSEIGQ